ncbi:MAG: bifunctional oligoribonuclease and phosphatase NrnA [Patescibacteria group bacterium]|nr:bifunctional oligoribonuclease and phosphatase NrnA [Patescibacteria group bacterium]
MFFIILLLVMNLEEKFKLAYSRLLNANQVLVIGHISPDPDALASMGAILELLLAKGVKFYAYADNKIEGLYSFIPHEELVQREKPSFLEQYSVILILDCGSLERTNLASEIQTLLNNKEHPFVIEIDHHQPYGSQTDLEIRLPDRASTTEIIYEFFQSNKVEVDKNMADCILIGLMSDTGNFIHPNSSFQALEVSSKMLLKGASLHKIGNYIRGSNSLVALKIWGRVFARLKYNPQTKFAYTALTKEDIVELDFIKYKEKLADIFGDIVSFISYLPGVDVALLLREENNVVKGSLRANNGNLIDVSQIARLFGGGGHKRAAGFSLQGSLEETGWGWRVVKK